jgi:hypothetical protein
MTGVLAEPLPNQIVVQAVGPLVTVIFGGFALSFITRQFQKRDADQKLRREMALEVARTGGLFCALAAAVMRAKATGDSALIEPARLALANHFDNFIVEGGVLERRLASYALSPAEHWHAATDCATVLYYHLTDAPDSTMKRIFAINENGYGGKIHSGLSGNDLRDQGKLMDQLNQEISNAAAGIQGESQRKVPHGATVPIIGKPNWRSRLANLLRLAKITFGSSRRHELGDPDSSLMQITTQESFAKAHSDVD